MQTISGDSSCWYCINVLCLQGLCSLCKFSAAIVIMHVRVPSAHHHASVMLLGSNYCSNLHSTVAFTLCCCLCVAQVKFVTSSTGDIVFDRAFNTASLLSFYYDCEPSDFAPRISWNISDPNVLQLSMPG